MTDDGEPLLINGKHIQRKLLETRRTQRCLTAECQSYCCSGGVWVDLAERDKILANAAQVKPYLPPERRDESKWFDGVQEDDVDFPSGRGEGTAVVDDLTHKAGYTCIFLRPEDRYCALQFSSIVRGEHPWTLKPFYCALHPITTEGDSVELDDENEIYAEGGHCQRVTSAPMPLYITFEGELRLVLGDSGYEELKRVAETP